MKTVWTILAAVVVAAALEACQSAEAGYIDLNTGERVELEKDEKTGRMINVETGKPVELYVDLKTRDTIYGMNGKVVNGKLKIKDGKYKYEAGDLKIKEEYESDGDYTAKYGDESKVKYDDGELKIKRPGYKKEVEKDGDVTIKTGNKKIKIDGETGERKVKYDD